MEVRLFLGYRLTKEFHIHLSQSSQWKETKELALTHFVEVQWEGSSYLGIHLPSSITTQRIAEKETEIKSTLQSYCPKLSLSKHQFHLFPQIFLL